VCSAVAVQVVLTVAHLVIIKDAMVVVTAQTIQLQVLPEQLT
jgi:hypothetical protein